ncbi:hypothetical protein HMPREF1092_03218 [Clostridium thermobutyricum]|uniref:Uncharacterized protein n=1 Tax=Clostridium thermobutyricum TaxID=29372 RepID=N9XIE6_9CLOT|nr:hypothetical protein [Clostridium thermobutyricum]ENY99477.1 hypothetical protein HMPREF1092_03218 [Clostridium thermobutyricum]
MNEKYEKKLDSIFQVVKFLGVFLIGVFGIDIKSLSIISQEGKIWVTCSMIGLSVCAILLIIVALMYLAETNRIYK